MILDLNHNNFNQLIPLHFVYLDRLLVHLDLLLVRFHVGASHINPLHYPLLNLYFDTHLINLHRNILQETYLLLDHLNLLSRLNHLHILHLLISLYLLLQLHLYIRVE
jgi:hypothetical protein